MPFSFMKILTSILCGLVLLLSSGIAGAQTRTEVLIKNATVLTAARGTLENTDILIRDGKIARIGKGLTADAGAKTIDATGKFVTPGIIDAHSHAMMDGQVNEGTYAVSSMTRASDRKSVCRESVWIWLGVAYYR